MRAQNVLIVGSPGGGKSCSAITSIGASPHEAAVVLDPHSHSLADGVLRRVDRPYMLFDNLSDLRHPLGYGLFTPSTLPGEEGLVENLNQSAGFVDLLLKRRATLASAGSLLAAAPLTEEWVFGLNDLYLWQRPTKPIRYYPCGFEPHTDEFRELIRDCTQDAVRGKFTALAKLTPRGLRAEVGSAARLVNALFRHPAFVRRAEASFDLGGFLQRCGLLIIERGEDIDDDAMRVLFGTVIQMVIRHVRRRPRPYPTIRIYIDEATNAGLVGGTELRAMAELRKYGLFFTVIVQNLDFPCPPERVLQLCTRHEYFRCSNVDLARKAATDLIGGIDRDDQDERSRAERIADLADDIMALATGKRWVREEGRSSEEYVELPENPWPDWPGFRDAKHQEKLTWIYSQPEYHRPAAPPSSPSSPGSPPPPPSSSGSSPAERFRRGSRRPTGGSAASGSEDESG